MIDLHLHLDGSLSAALVSRLGREQGLCLPQGEELERLLQAPEDCRSLEEYLRCFQLPGELLQSGEALEAAARDLTQRLAAQGLLYGEIRFAPQLHTRRGLTQAQAVEAVRAGAAQGCQGTELSVQLILCCMRGGEEADNRLTLETALRYLGQGVCAADLAGAEALYPVEEYRELFSWAKAQGLPFTLHAGEAAGPESVWGAVKLGASRIGHGVRAGEDPALLEFLKEEGIPLELCPTSNLQTKAVPSLDAFPLKAYLRGGLCVTVNTDNMTVSHTDLRREYSLLDLSPKEGEQLLRNSVQAAFLPQKEKEALWEKLSSHKGQWLPAHRATN